MFQQFVKQLISKKYDKTKVWKKKLVYELYYFFHFTFNNIQKCINFN